MLATRAMLGAWQTVPRVWSFHCTSYLYYRQPQASGNLLTLAAYPPALVDPTTESGVVACVVEARLNDAYTVGRR